MSERFERRYERLLRLYPKAYREQRGTEMLGTFLDAVEAGRARPTYREVAALVVGALRIRTGAVTSASAGRAWPSALRVTVLLLVANTTAQSVMWTSNSLPDLLMGRLNHVVQWGHVAAMVAGVLALLAIAGGRYGLGIVLAAVAFGFEQWAVSWLPIVGRLLDGQFWQLPLAMLLTVPLLVRRPAATGRPLAWLLAIPVALLLLLPAFDVSPGGQPYAGLAVGVGGLVWSLIDARAAIGGAALLLGPGLTLLCLELPDWGETWGPFRLLMPTYLALGAAMVGVGALLVRRRARA